MFGAHLPELMIVVVLALIVFGPKRLPEVGGAVGRSIQSFKKGVSTIEDHTIAHHETSEPQTVAAAVDTPIRDPQPVH